jgi:hypothetical protein
MSTLVNTAITSIVAALTRAPAVCSVVDRVRLRPVSQSAALAVTVKPVQAEVMQTALQPGLPVAWSTTISVECYARSNASTAPDVAVDPLLASVYARLMEDPTLAGVLRTLQPKGISFDFDADGETATCATLVFEALHKPGTSFT